MFDHLDAKEFSLKTNSFYIRWTKQSALGVLAVEFSPHKSIKNIASPSKPELWW